MDFKRLLIIIILSCSLFSCSKEFLDKKPLSEVTGENFFITASDLNLYTKGFYKMFPQTSIYSGDSKADNIVENMLSTEMRGARIVPTSGGGWDWGYLRDINYFLENYDNGDDEAAKAHHSGIAHFFRAYFYFEKVKRFGDVPFYDYSIEPGDEEALYKARDSRQFVVDRILEDLDYAIENLKEEQNVYEITKYSALALKARVGLYEGTYEKYRGTDGYEKFLLAAVEASEELIDNSPYALYNTGNPEDDYGELFNSHDAVSTEIILARKHDDALNVNHNANYYTTTGSYGMPGMPKEVINSYLLRDGSRFTDQPNYNQIFFTEEVKNRDPRLAQTIVTPGYTRLGQTTELSPNMGATVTGYQLIKFVTEPAHDTYSESIVDLPLFRYGETLLIYAEAKAELGNITQEDLDKSVNKLRARVDMPPMSLELLTNNPDPFLLEQYPNVSSNKAIILEIRRERRIELYMENFRWDDVVRWEVGSTLLEPLRGMYFPGPGEYDLTGNGDVDVVLYEGEEPARTAGIQYYKLNSDIILDDNGLIQPHPDSNLKFNKERGYLYPLPRLELQLNSNLIQNPGWE